MKEKPHDWNLRYFKFAIILGNTVLTRVAVELHWQKHKHSINAPLRGSYKVGITIFKHEKIDEQEMLVTKMYVYLKLW